MTTTTYLELEDQATGANSNTWGDVADANMAILEQAIARYATISTTGGTTTLTSAQNRYPVLRITGTLVSNATITVRTAEKNWTVVNATTGAYTVTVKTSGGTGKVIPRGRATKLYCDGTNVEYLRFPGIPAAQAGGTADAITATFEPATVAAELIDGTMWLVEAAGANTTTTPTFNPDATGDLTIKKNGGQALAVGDIRAAGHKLLLCYDASGGHVELLNPVYAAGLNPALTTIELGHASDTTLSRSAAGRMAVEGVDVALTTDILGQHTIWVPAAAMTARSTSGAAAGTVETSTNKVMLKTLDFDAATAEYAQFSIQMPKGWNEGTLICQFVWSHAATTTSFAAVWGIQALALGDNEAADTAFGTGVTVTDTGGTTNNLYITAETSAMTVGSSPAAENVVVFQVYRDAANGSDTLAIDARLHGVKIKYTIDAAKDD